MKIVTLIFAIIWTVIAVVAYAGTIGEKEESEDGSWKVFLVILLLCVSTAMVLWANYIYLLIK